MNTNKHHIDELVVRELGNIEILPPESIWLAIEKKLDKKKKFRTLYIRLGMAAGIAILATISGLYIYQTSQSSAPVVASNNVNNPVTGKTPVKNSSTQAVNVISHNNTIKNNAIATDNTKTLNKIPANTSNPIENYQEESEIADEIYIIEPQIAENNNMTADDAEDLAYLSPKAGTLPTTKNNAEAIIKPRIYNLQTVNVTEAEPQLAVNDIKPKVNRWSIEGQVAPIYAYRSINTTSSNFPDESEFNKNEKGIYSYSNVIKVNYKTNSRLSIQMGLAYSIMGQTITNIYVQQPAGDLNTQYATINSKTNSRINSSMGQINTGESESNSSMYAADVPTYFNSLAADKASYMPVSNNIVFTTQSNGNLLHRLKVLEIPVMARYSLIARKFSVYVLGGGSINFLLDNDAILKTKDNSENLGKTTDLKTMNLVGIIGTGFGYRLKNNITLIIEPTFKYYINSISKYDEIKVHPYSFGIYTGISYGF
jgi:hypothetical protein